MSLQDIYKNAGVVMKPAAMKDGKLYSQQPHSGAGDFNFSRADGVQTRINKHGLIETVANNEPRLSYDIVDGKVSDCPHLLLEPSRINSLLQSNQFDTTWYNSNTSESVSSGGFGGLDYWTITKTAASGWIRQNLSLSGVQTLSVYAKSGTLNWIRIIATGSSTASTWFDLQSGVVGSADFDTESSNIESVGDGWYRCSITVDIGTVNGVRFYPADGNNDVSGTSGSVLIQATQLESGSYPTSYIPTSGSTEQRQVDNVELSYSIESTEGFSAVVGFDVSEAGSGTSVPAIFFNDDTSNTYMGFGSTSTNFRCRLNLSGTSYLNTQGNAPRIQKNRLFMSCNSDGWSQGANGVINNTGTNDASVFNKLSSITASPREDVGVMKVSEMSLFKTRLSDSELELLTTP